MGLLDEADAAAAPRTSSGPAVPAYVDPSTLRRVRASQLAQLADEVQGTQPSLPSSVPLLLLDVREAAGPAAARTTRGASPSSDSLEAAELAGLPLRRVPLSALRRDAAEALAREAQCVVVLGTGDHVGEQAVVRMTRVYGLTNVCLLEWDA